ncbi:MAG: ATP phosphoribosyltransferase regulatory subunit, partial [Candidatus Helarchaeota archaeon]
MTDLNLSPPSGMRDFLPLEYKRRNYILDIIKRTYEKYGYTGIDTPAMERLEIIYGKTGEEQDKLIFKILKRGEKLERAIKNSEELSDYGLRFDLTVPLSRFYANYNAQLPRIFKRYQIGPVWRAERAQKGRFREFYQCDIDVVGSDSPYIEVEIILATVDVFTELGFKNFIINLNDRRILYQILNILEITKPEDTLIIIDKIDKIGRKEVVRQLNDLIGEHKTERLLTIFNSVESTDLASEAIKKFELAIKIMTSGKFDDIPYKDLHLIAKTLEDIGIENGQIIFNPYMVRGMT